MAGSCRHKRLANGLRFMHDLAAVGVLREMPFGKEKLFIQLKLMKLLSQESNQLQLSHLRAQPIDSPKCPRAGRMLEGLREGCW